MLSTCARFVRYVPNKPLGTACLPIETASVVTMMGLSEKKKTYARTGWTLWHNTRNDVVVAAMPYLLEKLETQSPYTTGVSRSMFCYLQVGTLESGVAMMKSSPRAIEIRCEMPLNAAIV